MIFWKKGKIKMSDFSIFIPYLPFLGVLITLTVPFYLMRLQGNKLRKEIEQIQQNISNAKTTENKDQITSLEILERIANTTSEELEKSLEKSITLRNLAEQVSLQNIQISQQRDIIQLLTTKNEEFSTILASEKAARIEVENRLASLSTELTAERLERQTAVAEIENLKSHSDDIIQKLTNRVKRLEEYIEENHLPIPNVS
jgi:chromosome segregation ATPase